MSDTVREVRIKEPRAVISEAVRRSAIRSTRESAAIEDRAIPVGYVRSRRVERFLDERRQRG